MSSTGAPETLDGRQEDEVKRTIVLAIGTRIPAEGRILPCFFLFFQSFGGKKINEYI